MGARRLATLLIPLLAASAVLASGARADGTEEEAPAGDSPFVGPDGEIRSIFQPEFREAPHLLEDLKSFQVEGLDALLVGPLLPPEKPGAQPVPSRLLLKGKAPALRRARQVLRYLDVPVPSVMVSLLAAEVRCRREDELGGHFGIDRTGGGPNTIFRALYSEYEPDAYLRSTLVPSLRYQGTSVGFGNIGRDVLQDGAFELVLRYLAHEEGAEFLAWPTVVCTEGVPGVISSLARTSQRVITSSQGDAVSMAVLPADTGITMQVLPQKVGTDAAVLDLRADLTFALPESTDASAAGELVLHHRRVQTRVTVRDGESLLLGGLRIRRRAGAERGLPVLIGIPGLTMTSKDCLETELVLLVKARVVVPDRTNGLVAPPGEARRLDAARAR